jgi:hypothetical protein
MSPTWWWYFWCGCVVLSVTSFALIAVLVLFRGVEDLREMIRILERQKRP